MSSAVMESSSAQQQQRSNKRLRVDAPVSFAPAASSDMIDTAAAVSINPEISSAVSPQGSHSAGKDHYTNLSNMLHSREWEKVQQYVHDNPNFANSTTMKDPTPLALSCRLGAPLECVRSILQAAPEHLRCVLDARGTPLHEAIVCEVMGAPVIKLLLEADEALGIGTSLSSNNNNSSNNNSSTHVNSRRAALEQDVDGFTPLHLLIRRRFQLHFLNTDPNATQLMEILELLVRSCPQAVIVPDCSEYEEPPIVYAVKADVYAPALATDDDETMTRVEEMMYQIVACMLRYCPQASSQVFTGYRGQYTALHSAVFHGRSTHTIQLLVEAALKCPSNNVSRSASRNNLSALTGAAGSSIPKLRVSQLDSINDAASFPPALLANTQGEVPLHFCAMRGERPRTVDVLARAAPSAVYIRDLTGLTPVHWIWIRYVGTLLTMGEDMDDDEDADDRDDEGVDATITLPVPNRASLQATPYSEFTVLETGEFDADLRLIKHMDPPVDFLGMRHIPMEVSNDMDCNMDFVKRSVKRLEKIRTRYENNVKTQQEQESRNEKQTNYVVWSRLEVVTSLFWNKLVSVLQAAKASPSDSSVLLPLGENTLLHTAFAAQPFPASVCYMASYLFPQDLEHKDERGRLPIHYAVSRKWHEYDGDSFLLNEPAAVMILSRESLTVMEAAVSVSPPSCLAVTDNNGQLPLHLMIETIVQCVDVIDSPMLLTRILECIQKMIQGHPESLSQPDGKTGLFPCLQATALAVPEQPGVGQNTSLSITYELLRENPTLICRM